MQDAEKSNADNPQVSSDGVSMPILNSDQNAWPPSNIREEVVQSAQEDAAQHQQGQVQQTASTSTPTPTDADQIVLMEIVELSLIKMRGLGLLPISVMK